MESEELEQREVSALLDRLTSTEIQRVMKILRAELASRQRSCSSDLNLQKYDSGCLCGLQDTSERSRSCLKKVEIHLHGSKLLIEACHGCYRFLSNRQRQ